MTCHSAAVPKQPAAAAAEQAQLSEQGAHRTVHKIRQEFARHTLRAQASGGVALRAIRGAHKWPPSCICCERRSLGGTTFARTKVTCVCAAQGCSARGTLTV